MLDKNDSFNIKLGQQGYISKAELYSTTIPWEQLSNDMKEVYIFIGMQRHKQSTVGAFNASRIRRRDNNQEQG